MPYSYQRTVHFQDTDAAGVVYFANVLAMCHEAYESSLATAGINLQTFFNGSEVAVPIVHASIDFLKPMFCGDRLQIFLNSMQITAGEFELYYQIFTEDTNRKPVSKAMTRHVCIDRATRQRCNLPNELIQWLGSPVALDSSPADD